MDRGYLALWRKFEDHPFWQEKREFSKAEAWLDILWQVQHSIEPKEVLLGMTCLTCNYGESLKSLDTWAKRWGWNKSKVRRFFKLLSNMGQLETKSEGKTTRITVLNYYKYDPKRNANETIVKRKRNDSETIATPDNNDKNVKNVKNNNKGVYTEAFLSFWEKYPNKKGKHKAFLSWKRNDFSNGLFDKIMASLDQHMKSEGWQKDGGRYIPHGSTWVNGKCWEDEIANGNGSDKRRAGYVEPDGIKKNYLEGL